MQLLVLIGRLLDVKNPSLAFWKFTLQRLLGTTQYIRFKTILKDLVSSNPNTILM